MTGSSEEDPFQEGSSSASSGKSATSDSGTIPKNIFVQKPQSREPVSLEPRKRENYDPDIHKKPLVINANEEKKGKKGREYIPYEDIVLSKAFVSATNNPIKGANQKDDVFMKDVCDRYNKLLLAEANGESIVLVRDVGSVTSRWKKIIQFQMNKFIKHYRKAFTPMKSGWNEEDYLNYACQLYKEQVGKECSVVHCIGVLRDLPRFDPLIPTEPNTKKSNS